MRTIETVSIGELESLGVSPLVRVSPERYVLKEGNTPLVYFGVSTLSALSSAGFPWAITKEKNRVSAKFLLTGARKALCLWSEKFENLYAIPGSSQNEKWLKAIGFELDSSSNKIYNLSSEVRLMRFVGCQKKIRLKSS